MAKLSLNLKQSQNLMMTPQLQQAIKLLTLTHLEMTDLISSEMVENPMLEEAEGVRDRADVEKDKKESTEAKSDDFTEPEIIEGGAKEIDWEKYIESFNSSSSAPPTKEHISKEDQFNYENVISRGESLVEHLESQLRCENLLEEELVFGLAIIHNLNDDGYLGISIEEIIAQSSMDREDSLEILKMIQSFNPVGCAASSLEDCLLVQARNLEERAPLVELIIKNHLTDLHKKDYQKISKDLGTNEESVKNAEFIIHGFHPKPGRLINNEDIHYVVPDIYVKEVGGEFVVQLNNDGIPALKISSLYKNLLKNKDANDEATKEYVQDKMRSALWLLKSIENRQRTIEKVANAIVKYQPTFFKKGPAHLRPMILKDIANEIGVHESTVSRVTTNKYMHTPIGVFELKYFFNAGIGGKNGGIDIASESLKMKIKELIDNEPPKKPLSDQKIVDLLKTQDIVVARRTVAKYRESMNILSSSKRKKIS